MKKIYYFILASAVSVALNSCTNDDIVGGENNGTEEALSEAIAFGFDLSNVTRAGDLIGSDAATKLQNQFVVFGTKHTSAETGAATNDMVVFKNYKVEYTDNSAGTTLSNTQNWEYVGLTPYASTIVSPVADKQTVKFWDYSAAQGYTFYAIASKADLSHETGGVADPLITVTKTESGTTVYDKGYSVVVKSGADLDKLYVSDRLPVSKTDYNKPVTLKFRNFGTRVRVGFYETIPGYTVTINKFYTDADASTTAVPATAPVVSFDKMTDANTTNFAASIQNVSKTPTTTGNTMTVSYYSGGTDGIENQVKVNPSSDVEYNYSLELGSGVVNTVLAETSAAPTWDQTSGAYTTVYPCSSVANPMLVKVDYTLTAEDGSGETIEVTGANVVVPTQYLQWKSNFAYTYIFKISNDTNGYIGDVQGLYPITFDAVVVDVTDDKTQETITKFGNYAITTYVNGSNVTTDNEYKKAKDIYVVKTDVTTHAVATHTAIGTAAGNAQVYTVTTTGDAISEATIKAKLTGSPNGITLAAVDPAATLESSAPTADGKTFSFGDNGAVKFTPGAAGTYAYVSTRSAYVAPTYTPVGDAAWSETTTYYFKTSLNVYYAASGINADNFGTKKANLYIKTADGTPGEYDIKVIKVVD